MAARSGRRARTQPARAERYPELFVSRHGLVTDAATSARLSRQRQRDTSPELDVRRAVTALGAKYRIANRDLPGSPDLANRSRHWAIFVHGCYWHGHRGCARASVPKRNRGFWQAKFEANRQRDRRKESKLRARGFHVLTIWECEVADSARLRAKLRRLLARDED